MIKLKFLLWMIAIFICCSSFGATYYKVDKGTDNYKRTGEIIYYDDNIIVYGCEVNAAPTLCYYDKKDEVINISIGINPGQSNFWNGNNKYNLKIDAATLYRAINLNRINEYNIKRNRSSTLDSYDRKLNLVGWREETCQYFILAPSAENSVHLEEYYCSLNSKNKICQIGYNRVIKNGKPTFIDIIDIKNYFAFNENDRSYLYKPTIFVGDSDGYLTCTNVFLDLRATKSVFLGKILSEGVLACNDDGNLVYYVTLSNFGIQYLDLKWHDGSILLGEKHILFNWHPHAHYDYVFCYLFAEGSSLYMRLPGDNGFPQYEKNKLKIADIIWDKPKNTSPLSPTAKDISGNVNMQTAMERARSTGTNISCIVYGAPFRISNSGKGGSVPTFSQTKVNSKITADTNKIGGGAYLEVGVFSQGLGSEASMGAYGAIEYQHSSTTTKQDSFEYSMNGSFNDIDKDDDDKQIPSWNVGKVYFSTSKVILEGWTYVKPLKRPDWKLNLPGFNRPCFIYTPICSIVPAAGGTTSCGFYLSEPDKRVGQWAKDSRLSDMSMLTAGMHAFPYNRNTDSHNATIDSIVKWQKEKLNLDLLFQLGNENDSFIKQNFDYTGVVPAFASESTVAPAWGYKYNLNDDTQIKIYTNTTTDITKSLDWKAGLNFSVKVNLTPELAPAGGGVGPYAKGDIHISGGSSTTNSTSDSNTLSINTTGSASISGTAYVAVAMIDAAKVKGYLYFQNEINPKKYPSNAKPGWIPTYAWENNSKFMLIIPYILNGSVIKSSN